jgi:hypothetical protein
MEDQAQGVQVPDGQAQQASSRCAHRRCGRGRSRLNPSRASSTAASQSRCRRRAGRPGQTRRFAGRRHARRNQAHRRDLVLQLGQQGERQPRRRQIAAPVADDSQQGAQVPFADGYRGRHAAPPPPRPQHYFLKRAPGIPWERPARSQPDCAPSAAGLGIRRTTDGGCHAGVRTLAPVRRDPRAGGTAGTRSS